MGKRRICVVITARASYARVKSALIAIRQHPDLELQLVLAGSVLLEKYGSTVEVIERNGFYVTEKIYNVVEGETNAAMVKTTGLAILELATVFQKLKPDIVVTIADRFETIATSIAACYQNIPLAHIQGGEVTGNIDEKVRHANTKLADFHLVASEKSRERVVKMGEKDSVVINTGCPSMDIAREVLRTSKLDFDPIKKYGGVGNIKDWRMGYLVVMQHPVTTEYEKAREHISITLQAVNEINIPTFWFWPNADAGNDGTSKGIRTFREFDNPQNIKFFKNMDPEDFLVLIKHSKCLIGNSSVGIRESSFLGIPVVNIGTRQNRRERSKNVIDCTHDKEEIKKAIKFQLLQGQYESDFIFGDGFAGQKIADALAEFQLSFNKVINY